MRRKPPRGGSTGSRLRVLGACVVVLAGIWLGSMEAAPAVATACPNAQFRSGPSEHLPDCRAYEQVSPVQKGGLDAVALQPLQPAQSSACQGGAPCTIAYMNVGAAFAGAPGNDITNAYLASRGTEGWQTTPLAPPTPEAPANSLAKVSYAFSGDLSQSIVRVPLQQLTEGAPSGVYNLFQRQEGGTYSLVTAIAPPDPPEAGCGRCFETQDVPAFAGASSDFSHVIFEANDALLAGAPGPGVENLYEATGGEVRLVGYLPDGEIDMHGATAGGGINAVSEHAHELAHAISQSGADVLFEAAAEGEPDPEQAGMMELYDRIDGSSTTDSSTVEISAPASGARSQDCETKKAVCNPEPARFWAASADGSVIYFTSKAALTKQSYTGAEPTSGPPQENPGDDLYRYDLATRTLADLTSDADNETEDPNGASVLGVVGASEDGSYVYFVADGNLAAGATSGSPNLYVWHEAADGASAVTFIATLQPPSLQEEKNIEALRGGELEYHSDIADWTSRPTESQAYVTPDGKHLAFMSVNHLTGYDNEDPVTEEPDHEVFEYSAETDQLVCASCDPSRDPPLGSAFLGARLGERVSTPFHQPRSLSDDGSRVFFSSPDPLVPGLAGGSVKVFEYENGAPQLISGMEGGGEAVFLDASASGNDVFLATRERLALSDLDELADVYDARVDGGRAAPVTAAQCVGGTCQEPFNAPPTFSVPGSASFAGVGNLAPPPPPAKLTRKQLLARAVSACRKLKSRKKRSACVVAAERRYGPKARRARRGDVAGRRRSRR
jgi:hypothetical protein